MSTSQCAWSPSSAPPSSPPPPLCAAVAILPPPGRSLALHSRISLFSTIPHALASLSHAIPEALRSRAVLRAVPECVVRFRRNSFRFSLPSHLRTAALLQEEEKHRRRLIEQQQQQQQSREFDDCLMSFCARDLKLAAAPVHGMMFTTAVLPQRSGTCTTHQFTD